MSYKNDWEMAAVLRWVWPDGSRQQIPVRFYYSQPPTIEKAIRSIVNLQAGYSPPPTEIEVWPAIIIPGLFVGPDGRLLN